MISVSGIHGRSERAARARGWGECRDHRSAVRRGHSLSVIRRGSMGVSMATERPILDALKQVFAALIPVLLQWLLKLAIPATPTPKVASRDEKSV